MKRRMRKGRLSRPEMILLDRAVSRFKSLMAVARWYGPDHMFVHDYIQNHFLQIVQEYRDERRRESY